MSGNGPTAVMRDEHRRIKGFLENIHDKIANENMNTDALENGLLEILTLHNNKEENILYPWIDETLNETEIKEILLRMENLPPEKYSGCCGIRK